MGAEIANHRAETPRHFVRRGKVLLVEPDSRERQYYSAILRQRGFEVCACASYPEGVQYLNDGPIDLVVIYQGSSAFEGRMLLERATVIDRRMPVLVLTRAVDMNCYLEAMQLGAVDYLEKPLTPAEIVRVVETHLPTRMATA